MPDTYTTPAQKWFPPQGVGPQPPAASRGIGYDSARIRDITELSLWLAAIGAGTGAGVGLLNRIKDDIRGEKKKRMSLVTSALLGAGAGAGLGLSTGVNKLEAKPVVEKEAAGPLLAAIGPAIGLAFSTAGVAMDAYDVHKYNKMMQSALASGRMKEYQSYKILRNVAAASLPTSAIPYVGAAKRVVSGGRMAARAGSGVVRRGLLRRAVSMAPRAVSPVRIGVLNPALDISQQPGYVPPGQILPKAELDRIGLDHKRRLYDLRLRHTHELLNRQYTPKTPPPPPLPTTPYVPPAKRWFGKQGAAGPTLDSLYAAIANDYRLGPQEKLDAIARIKAAVGSGKESMSLSELVASGLGGVLGYWVSRYFGTGILGSILLSSAGVYAGNRLHRALTAEDPTPGWRILR